MSISVFDCKRDYDEYMHKKHGLLDVSFLYPKLPEKFLVYSYEHTEPIGHVVSSESELAPYVQAGVKLDIDLTRKGQKIIADLIRTCHNDFTDIEFSIGRKNMNFTPKKIIFNKPATIVFWEDGTKTVVKCSEDDKYSEYFGFLAALAKKIYGNSSRVRKIVEKWTPKTENDSEKEEE